MTTKDVPAHPDESERQRAVEALPPEDTEALIRALDDASWRVRRTAVDRLVRRGGTQVVGAVLRAMCAGHRSLSVLNGAIQILTVCGVDTLGPLQEYLAGPDVDLRAYAAHTLGKQHDARAVPALIRAVGDPDSNVRFHAIEALGSLRSSEAVEVLLAVAESRDFALAFPALDALAAIGDSRIAYRLVPLLGNTLLRDAALDALGRLGNEEVVAPLAEQLDAATATAVARSLTSLHDRYERTYRRGATIVELARRAITPAGVQTLIEAVEAADEVELKSLSVVLAWLPGQAVERTLTRLLGHPAARAAAVDALVSRGTQVTESVIRQLEAEDLETRKAAVIVLGRIGDGRAVPALLRTLDDEELTVGVAGALANSGDPRAYQPLLRFIGHYDASIRRASISALNSLGHADMASDLVRLLQDPAPLVRESALRLAAYAGYPECIELLLTLCKDAQENVRRVALESLPNVDDERILASLTSAVADGSVGVRAAAARALGQVEGTEIASLLLTALADTDAWVRYYAVRSLEKHADNAAREVLTRLAREDPAMQVRVAAVEALGRVGDSEILPILAELAEVSEIDLARAATAALGRTGHPAALSALMSILDSSEPVRRISALGALAASGRVEAAAALQRRAETDSDADVVRAALDGLARLKVPEAVDALVALAVDPSRRHACIAALARVDKLQVPRIADGLRHENPDVRRAVVEALARTNYPHLSELLMPALGDADASVRGAVIAALAYANGQ